MGSGGNVGRAIYARDLSRDKSRGEYIRAHMFPRWRNTLAHEEEEEKASHGGGIDLCASWHRLTTPFSRSSFRSTSPPPRSRGWSPFSARAILRPRLSPQRVFHFSFARPQFVHVSAGTRVQFTPFSKTRPKTRTCRVSGNSFVIPVEYRTRVALTTRNDEEKKVGAIKRYEWNLGRSFIVHRMVSHRASHIFQKDAINLTIEVTFTRRHSYAIPRYDTQARYIKINNESNDLLTCFLKIGVTFFDSISAWRKWNTLFDTIRKQLDTRCSFLPQFDGGWNYSRKILSRRHRDLRISHFSSDWFVVVTALEGIKQGVL